MNRGLILKAAYEIWPATIACGALLCGMEALVAYVLPSFQEQFAESFAQIEFIGRIVRAILGTDMEGELSPQAFLALPWVHPVILALLWAHAAICCTRVPAGEIDRGTADVLLGLPLGRWEVLISETLVWIVASGIVLGLLLIGNLLGSFAVSESVRPGGLARWIVLGNLACVYLSVGGFSWLASSMSDRRGWAISVVFVFLLLSFLLNYLAQFWEPADRFRFLSLLAYYRPLAVLREPAWPVGDMAVLLTAAVVLWTAAGIVFARRDICTN